MDPAREADAAMLAALLPDLLALPAEQLRAEIEQLPPAGQCAVLGHNYPQVWTVGHDAGAAGEYAATYYARTCPRCGSIEVTNGRSWPI